MMKINQKKPWPLKTKNKTTLKLIGKIKKLFKYSVKNFKYYKGSNLNVSFAFVCQKHIKNKVRISSRPLGLTIAFCITV